MAKGPSSPLPAENVPVMRKTQGAKAQSKAISWGMARLGLTRLGLTESLPPH